MKHGNLRPLFPAAPGTNVALHANLRAERGRWDAGAAGQIYLRLQAGRASEYDSEGHNGRGFRCSVKQGEWSGYMGGGGRACKLAG